MIGTYVDLGDVPFLVECELGRKRLKLGEGTAVKVGSVIELDKLAGETMDIRVNGELFAEGEIVALESHMAVRVTSMWEPATGDGGGTA